MPKRVNTELAERQSEHFGRKVGYLVNQYPAISHTFIRNEILALESLGMPVARFAVRGWNNDLVQQVDLGERNKTTYILATSKWKIAFYTCRFGLISPVRSLRALRLAIGLSTRGGKSAFTCFAYFIEACVLAALAEAREIKHIHAHFGTNSSSVAMLAACVGGMTFSFTIHGPEEFDQREALHIRDKVLASKFVAVVSSFGRSQVYRIVDSKVWPKVHLIRCGLASDYLKAETSSSTGDRSFVCVGRLSEQKGQAILIEACAVLAERDVSFNVAIIGDGELRDDLKAMIDNKGLHEKVRLLGWQNADVIQATLSKCSALVMPSFAEGLPVAIMEAMALGKPVISTFIAGIPELVQDKINGYLVPAGDYVALADVMQRLLGLDSATYEKMSHDARLRVREKHDSVLEVKKLLALFAS